MQEREAYHQKYEAQLKEWDAKIDELKAHAQKATAEVKVQLTQQVHSLQGKLDVARAKLSDVRTSSDSTWEQVKKTADNAWHDAKSAAEGAIAAIKQHKHN